MGLKIICEILGDREFTHDAPIFISVFGKTPYQSITQRISYPSSRIIEGLGLSQGYVNKGKLWTVMR